MVVKIFSCGTKKVLDAAGWVPMLGDGKEIEMEDWTDEQKLMEIREDERTQAVFRVLKAWRSAGANIDPNQTIKAILDEL